MYNSPEHYPIFIVRSHENYHAIVRELAILESGPNLQEVYDRAEIKRTDVIANFRISNLSNFLPSVQKAAEKPKKFHWTTLVYVAIIAAFLTVPIVSVTHPLSNTLTRVSRLVGGLTEYPLSESIVKLSDKIDEMPVEKKERLQKAIHNIASNLAPFVQAFYQEPLEKEAIAAIPKQLEESGIWQSR